ncbi:elongation factor Tu [Paecilomyces variotii No. 5]|uniref:Translation initiation factor IF-2, mitochondrial n=1 Tax=Byssochlamys spectabilis (strain No. 5 / NBRC 109023) TaxID=1356009 RepID=V5HUK4_BYSSN|nr:elongation factor Tu [Paecilomyces variotii No. 5]
MHKWAVLELSRCHRVDRCAARCRCLSPASPTWHARRGFRSSIVRNEGSDTTPVVKEEENGEARESLPRAKWGGGWANRSANKSAGLALSEQAQRDALLSQHRKEEPKETRQNASEETQNPEGGKSGQRDRLLPFISKHGVRSGQRQHRDHRPAKREQDDRSSTRDMWNGDWECPECRYHCFRRHNACPACNAPHPEQRTKSKKPDTSEQSLKIRKLGQSVLADWDQLTFREKAFRDHTVKKGSFSAVRPVPVSSPRRDRSWTWTSTGQEANANTEISESFDQTQQEESDITESTQPSARSRIPISIPDHIEEDVQWRKMPKRRSIRNTRQVEPEEDEFDDDESRRRRREERKRMKKEKARRKQTDAAPSPLYLPEFISVSNLADVIGVRPATFVQRMEEMGFEGVTYNHILDAETAGLVATEFNFEPIFEKSEDDLTAAPEPEDKSVLPPRPPVVTIMGHVDHGKTTILDWLRKSSIAASEHGGITQHIGAFSVSMPSGKVITFLDTPGHAAFLDMRRRGADVTDVVVLVVAADDSVKPQTIEAIKHAKDAKVPMIVAINKIDKDNVNPELVKQDLARHSVDVEDYGGDVQAIPVSGKTGQGMLDLEEAIVTLSEMLDHRAAVDGNVEGWVIEATTKSSGRVATVLVRRGTLRPGDILVAGTTWARVRTLKNEAGVEIKEATPGMPVEIDGWKEQPAAGSEVLGAPNEQKAKDVVEYRQEKSETQKLGQDMAAINESRREMLEKRRREAAEEEGDSRSADDESSGPKPIHFIVKADVSGSVEAVMNSVSAIGNNEVYANVLRSGVGGITEFDIQHAQTANGHIVSFNVPVDPSISRMAESSGVKILDHNIIYELIDSVKAELSEHLPPTVSRRVTGEAEISQIFDITIKGRETTSIAGCKVRNGTINRNKKVRVLRGQDIIYDGSFTSLKNVKKDVVEMRKDTECGMGFEGWSDFAVGDHVQCYDEIYEKRYL